MQHKANPLRPRILGIDRKVPLLDGSHISYVNLDNGASTPPLIDVMDTLNEFMPYYSSVHRGTGFKSRLSTIAYDQAHEIIAKFVGANIETNAIIFGKNATEAINKLSYRFNFAENDVVITTMLEHHSDDLPWRRHAKKVVHVKATPEGRLDEEDFDRQLAKYGERVALVAVTGASNVTGFVSPIHRLARKAHAIGAKIMVDAAQLAPHRRIDMKADDDPEHLDFLVLSAHKMYAPFGTGVLIGQKSFFERGEPEYCGGGTINLVTTEEVYWADAPDRDEAGSPNVPGAVAMAKAAQVLMDFGMDTIAEHEAELTAYALEKLSTIPGIKIYGETDPAKVHEKVGVIPFALGDMPHALVASILGYEAGIGVRSGCFCAHPYVVHLLDLDKESSDTLRREMIDGNRSHVPGLVRMSFGCYNDHSDVDRFVTALHRIADGDYQGEYTLNAESGEYTPTNFVEPVADYFVLDGQNQTKE